jgi:DNA-binding CsgD family transcriptional regulator
MRRGTDLGAVVEAAYAPAADDAAWLAHVLACVRQHVPNALSAPLAAITFALTPDGSIVPDVVTGLDDELERTLREFAPTVPRAMTARLIGTGAVVGSGTGLLGVALNDLPDLAPVAARGAVDTFTLVATNPDGRGCMVALAFADRSKQARRSTERWKRVAIHVAAGLRLRRSDGQPEAVLTPNGRVSHAEASARTRAAREQLRAAAIAIDRVRCRASRDELLTVWEGLVGGRWSLVDHFDSDGRRFLVARRNDPPVQPHVALTFRERQIVALASCGHTDKYIAYALGIGRSSVATHIAAARSKLGCGSRVELVRLGAQLGAADRHAPGDA